MRYCIVRVDNEGSDSPNERFIKDIPSLSKDDTETICNLLNKNTSTLSKSYWRVVPCDYVLQPGFEP